MRCSTKPNGLFFIGPTGLPVGSHDIESPGYNQQINFGEFSGSIHQRFICNNMEPVSFYSCVFFTSLLCPCAGLGASFFPTCFPFSVFTRGRVDERFVFMWRGL